MKSGERRISKFLLQKTDAALQQIFMVVWWQKIVLNLKLFVSYESNFSGRHVSCKVSKKAFSENASECPTSFINPYSLVFSNWTNITFFLETIKRTIIPYTIFSINCTQPFIKDNRPSVASQSKNKEFTQYYLWAINMQYSGYSSEPPATGRICFCWDMNTELMIWVWKQRRHRKKLP